MNNSIIMSIEMKDGKLFVGGHRLPKGDVDILIQLLREGLSAFELMQRLGKIYPQYIQLRLRVLISLGVIIKTAGMGNETTELGYMKRVSYEINPEIKEELKGILNV